MVKIDNIIVWVLFILAVIVSIWYIFGNSPTFEQAILSISIAFLFTLGLKVGAHESRLNSFERRFDSLEKSFINLVKDFKVHITKHN